MRIKGNKFFLMLFMLIIPNVIVNASTKQVSKCFGDDGLYTIIYDDSKNTFVNPDNITLEDIENGHLTYPNGVEDDRYKFTASIVASKCYIDGSKIKSCPSNTQITFDKINNSYLNGANVTDNITIAFNENSGRFNIFIKDVFSNQLKVKYITQNVDLRFNIRDESYEGYFLEKNGTGYRIDGVNGNKAVLLEFYQKSNDPCDGTFIGSLVFYTPNVDDIEITNPAGPNSSTRSSYNCGQVDNYLPKSMRDAALTSFTNFKKSYISECYSAKIKYSEKAGLAQTINEKFAKFKELYDPIYNLTPGKSSNGASGCNAPSQGATPVSYGYHGKYWAMTCYEEYTSETDGPQLVKAGDGFAYNSTFHIKRTCNVVQLSKPVKKPQCQRFVEVSCSYTDAFGVYHSGGGGMPTGPNDLFDSCIQKCDGGKYTQSCINSCYSSSYTKNRNMKFSTNFSIENKNSNIVFTASDSGSYSYSFRELIESGQIQAGKAGFSRDYGYTGSRNYDGTVNRNGPGWPGHEYTFNGQTVFMSDWCLQKSDGDCVISEWDGPSGCSWHPEEEYANEMGASAGELGTIYDMLYAMNIEVGEYSIDIIDSYLNDGRYEFHYSDGGNLSLTKESSGTYTVGGSSASTSFGASGPAINGLDIATYPASLSRQVDVKTSLAPSYINRKVGTVAYKSGANAYNNMQQSIPFNEKDYYESKGRLYFTDIHSRNINVGFSNGLAVLSHEKNNIAVSGKGLGAAGFTPDISCYYGVYNGFYNYDDDGNPCLEGDVCDGGIQYVFRPIVLGDVFPNGRAPRYNWSSAATGKGSKLYNATVDPVKYTQNIQTKQETIYDTSSGEIDYEFILTPKSIAAIKAYNKSVEDFNKDGAKNYLDYDLSCYTRNGREVCTSRFLDKTDILMYGSGYTVDQRKSIAGCNNARDNGTACDTSAHQ